MATEHDVVIAGSGPTGLMLAAELALAGVEPVVLERRPDQEIAGSRAGGLHSRTIEVFDQRGIADRFLSQGQVAQVGGFAFIKLDISDFPTRHNYGLGLWQNHIERILADWVRELGVRVRYGVEVAGFEQDADGVDVRLADGGALRARYLIGCDGGRSTIRKAARIDFPGWDPTVSHLLAEVEMAEPPAEWGGRRDEHGLSSMGRVSYEVRDGKVVYADSGPVRILLTERSAAATNEPTLEDLKAALVTVYGTDFAIHSPISITRFTDMTRQAARYRERRVLLAGDAAHVHAPTGGQGLNIGVQDAVNLGWKLAQVVRGVSPDALLDSYHAERHPVAARVLQNTMAQMALVRTDDRTKALHDIVSELLAMEQPRRHVAGMISGLDVHYDLGEGHPLLGRRMPDLDLAGAGGAPRMYALLHDARPVLLELGADGARAALPVAPWSDRVRRVQVAYDGPWELPVIGPVAAPSAVLIRPDGYVAWVGEGSERGLADALTRWFGAPGAAPSPSPPAASR